MQAAAAQTRCLKIYSSARYSALFYFLPLGNTAQLTENLSEDLSSDGGHSPLLFAAGEVWGTMTKLVVPSLKRGRLL